MTARIAIPEPTSLDHAYSSRALPQYIQALRSAGTTPLPIPLTERPEVVARLLAGTQGVLLLGSRYDIDPQVYGEERIPECADPDPARAAVDELLLQDAFNLRKPVLAICYGIQSLNVWRNGSLLQDLHAAGFTAVNHAPGRHIDEAHPIRLAPGSRLERLVPANGLPLLVNSSHHQALKAAGDNLRVTATCPVDGVIEAVELNSPDHFVVGVQWHPERTYATSDLSRALFAALVHEAEAWRPQPARESVLPA
ncbi:gamma-glutamyl-gamma-aminobutyrate hydrolase family protein [Acidobacteria bacterium AB60]|nr:gamma-glutamyl-gamma-aminobutyrate hydrolase family protein [Acidobacteria bacterium AB60]